jgi:hypothetical protein
MLTVYLPEAIKLLMPVLWEALLPSLSNREALHTFTHKVVLIPMQWLGQMSIACLCKC